MEYRWTQWITTSEVLFRKIYTSQFICEVSKMLFKVLLWEGVGDRTELQYIDPPLLWPSTLSLSRSPDAQPETQGLSFLLSAGFPYHILLATSLDPNSSRAPRVPSAGLSLPHLISNFSGPQLIRGSKGPFSLAWLSLTHLISNSNCLTSWLDWVI